MINNQMNPYTSISEQLGLIILANSVHTAYTVLPLFALKQEPSLTLDQNLLISWFTIYPPTVIFGIVE